MNMFENRHWYEWRDAPVAEFAVLGNPVSHSRSPMMHEATYSYFGLAYRYLALRVAPGELAAAMDHLRKLGYRGVNVTVPLKSEALAWCEHADGFAQRVGAVNTISLKTAAGTNTDGAGFLRTIEDTPGEVLICGAGGSARAIVGALSTAGRHIRIWNRTISRAEQLAGEWPNVSVASELKIGNAAIVVNATSATLEGADLALDWPNGASSLIAYDVMYQAEPGPFIRAAKSYGFRTIDGLPMLAAQGALAFRYWLSDEIGDADPYPVMLGALLGAVA